MHELRAFAAVATIVLATAAPAGANGKTAAASVYFRGHGGHVVCGVFSGSGEPSLLECGTAGELDPTPPRPSAHSCGGLDFAGNRIRLAATGGAFGLCSGDVGVLANIDSAPRLGYGTSKHVGPFTCTSTVAWLTCTNRSGRGFALSQSRWRAVS
jgi:hypothetical protein